MKILSRCLVLVSSLAFFALSGCASNTNPAGDSYDEPVVPGKTKLLNLTGQASTEGAAQVYISASSRNEMMVTFRDRLIAYQVDGKDLPGAKAGYTPTGYQALALAPGVHSISYCHTTKSDLGTGMNMCRFKIDAFNFEANARYLVIEKVSVTNSSVGGGISQSANVGTSIMKLD